MKIPVLLSFCTLLFCLSGNLKAQTRYYNSNGTSTGYSRRTGNNTYYYNNGTAAGSSYAPGRSSNGWNSSGRRGW